MTTLIRRICIAAFLNSLLMELVNAASMQFSSACVGNAEEACYILAKGVIDAGTAQRFEAFVHDAQGHKVLLSSEGGSLGEGLLLGRAIRRHEYTTYIASAPDSVFEQVPDGAKCLSACAYAFLGGTTRFIPTGARLGFHQFRLKGDPAAFSSGAGQDEVQQVSGLIVDYLRDMEIDPRLFSLASGVGSDGMFFPSEDQLARYDLVTIRLFRRFSLEPQGTRVVAMSERLTAVMPYDRVTRLSVDCAGPYPQFVLSARNAGVEPSTHSPRVVIELTESNGTTSEIRVRGFKEWEDTTGGLYIAFVTDPLEPSRLSNATELGVHAVYYRAAGGDYRATVELAESDRKVLRAALAMCTREN